MHGGRFYAMQPMNPPASAAAFVDDSNIAVASKDAKGISKVKLYQIKFDPAFKATAAISASVH
jgi:hypothetical protein